VIVDLQPCIAALGIPGAVVLAPTSTLYGLSGLASDEESCLRIARLKNRAPGPLIVLINHLPPRLLGLGLEAVWPGPVTILVEREDLDFSVANANVGPDGRVAVRWDSEPILAPLIAAVGPVTSTSANLHGQAPILAPAQCPVPVDAVVDDGPRAESLASTMVDLRGRRILREGAALAAARAFLGRLD
jgi:tRNA A37 threonylcarbamoyladenosine synthetase subunit TsaC/SUA5/YrdC